MQNRSFGEQSSGAPAFPPFDDAVADSVKDFSSVQGSRGWWYGYMRAKGAFRPFERYEAGRWCCRDSPAPAISATALEASPGLIPVRRWTPRASGSVRLVGIFQKRSSQTEAEFRILVDDKVILERRLGRTDTMAYAFDLLALDLTESSTIDVLVVAASHPVEVVVMFQILPEPFVSRWHPDLPTGFPAFTEDQKKALRQKGQKALQDIRDALAAGRRRVVIPPGDYLFHANWSRASTLKNLADLEIDARGVTFWFEPPLIHALLFENCRNVTVRGLTIDFTIPCWFQARVIDIDRKKKTVRAVLMPGYPPRDADGKEEKSGERTFMFYDANGRFINHRHTPGTWRLLEDGSTVLCHLKRYGIPDALRPGDYIVGAIRTGAALRSVNCSGMRFEDINIWSSPGMAIYEGGGEGGNVYHHVRATRRPRTNRLHAFGADVFHLASTNCGPTLDRCEAAYGADDVINIHGDFGRVVQRVDDRRYYLQGVYEVGDMLEFRDQFSVELLGIAKVVAVEKTPDGPSLPINKWYQAKGEWLVTLDKGLDLPPLSLVVMDGKRSASGFVIRNCWFHDDFQRTLINGAPNGLIENTTFQNLGYGICVQFETWGPWMEGPFARNLTIRNNRFLNAPPTGPSISVSMHPPGGGSDRRRFKARPVTNLAIVGNYFFFARPGGALLSIHNVDGLQIYGNVLDWPSRVAAPCPDRTDWVYLQDCGNVSVCGNRTPSETQRMPQ